MNRLVISALGLLIFCATTSHANSFRCPNGKLIMQDDTTLEVKMKCGKPAEQEYVGNVDINGKYVNLDRYLYIPGKGKLMIIVEFHDGKVVKISNGIRVK